MDSHFFKIIIKKCLSCCILIVHLCVNTSFFPFWHLSDGKWIIFKKTFHPEFASRHNNMRLNSICCTSRINSLLKLRLKLRLSHLNFICIHALQINFISRLLPVTGKDELDKLVCSQLMGLHCSVGRALQSYRRGHGFEYRRALIIFFRLKFAVT